MYDVITTGIVFYAIYMIVKQISDYLLRRRIVKSGHTGEAGILRQSAGSGEEVNRYPSLKWAIVIFMAGAGLILIECLRFTYAWFTLDETLAPLGIELVFISLGFLIYFIIVFASNRKK